MPPPSLRPAVPSQLPRARTTTRMETKTTRMTRLSFPASGGLPPPRAQAQRGGAPLVVLWEARKPVWVPARTMSCPDSAVGEAAVLVMVVMRFLGSVEGEGLSLALVVVRTAHQCRRLQMARVRVAGRKVTIGLIGGAGEMGEVGGGAGGGGYDGGGRSGGFGGRGSRSSGPPGGPRKGGRY